MRVFLFLCSLPLAAQTDSLPPELLQLGKIKIRMIERLTRQPNYTCIETIERSRRRNGSRKFELVDTLRLEVALVEGKELFAWPGERSFHETELNQMVQGGAIGNGNFALHARAVFSSGGPSFTYAGPVELDGKATVRYDFRVAQMASGYHIRSGGREAVVGYHGSFWADAETLDITRLEISADDLPPILQLQAAADRMSYAPIRIGEADFLLPVESELSMVDYFGTESRNRVRFTACRQYQGESVLTFGDAPPESAPEPVKAANVELPEGLLLDLALETPIGSATPLGQEVRARLLRDSKLKGRTMVPKGALFSGRLVRLEHNGTYVLIGLQLSRFSFPGAEGEANLELDDIPALPLAPGLRRFDAGPGLYGRGPDFPPLHPQPGVSLFYWKGERLNLARGLRMTWKTVKIGKP